MCSAFLFYSLTSIQIAWEFFGVNGGYISALLSYLTLADEGC